MFCPDYAVDRLAGRVSDGAAGKGLLVRLGLTLVALGGPSLDDGHLAQVARGAGLDQWQLGSQTHPVEVVASSAIVQGAQADGELLVEVDTVLGLNSDNEIIENIWF